MSDSVQVSAAEAESELFTLGYGVTTPSAEALYQHTQQLVDAVQAELSGADFALQGYCEETTLGQPIEFQPKAVAQITGYAQHVPFALVMASSLELNLVDESTNLTVPLGAAELLGSPGLNLIDLIALGPARCDETLFELHQHFQSWADLSRSYALSQAHAILRGLAHALTQYDSASGSMNLPPITVTPEVTALRDAQPWEQRPKRQLCELMQEVVDSPRLPQLPPYAVSAEPTQVYAYTLPADYVPDSYTLEDIVISPESFRLELKGRTELDLVTTHQCELVLGGNALHLVGSLSLEQLLGTASHSPVLNLDLEDIMTQLHLKVAALNALALSDTYMEFNALCANLQPVAASELSALLSAPPPPPKKEEPINHGADLAALQLALELTKAQAHHGKLPSQAELDQILAALRPH